MDPHDRLVDLASTTVGAAREGAFGSSSERGIEKVTAALAEAERRLGDRIDALAAETAQDALGPVGHRAAGGLHEELALTTPETRLSRAPRCPWVILQSPR